MSQVTAGTRKTGLSSMLEPDYLAVLLVAAAYVVFAEIGFSLAFAPKQVTAVWPPTGIAIAALLLRGYRVWPGIWLGAFIANAFSNEPIFTAAGIAVGNTIGPVLGAFLLRRFVVFDNALERLRDVQGLVLVGSALAMTVTATNGVLNLGLAGIVSTTDWASVWWLWWAGDSMGVLLVAPLILTWANAGYTVDVRGRVVELTILGVALVATTLVSFMSSLPLAYPVYPFVIWTALRFRQPITTLAIVVISTIAVWGTIRGLGPFSNGTLDHRLILLVTFMAVLAVTGLVLGAVTAERRMAAAQLAASEQRFQVLAELVPQMVWTADATGWIDWHNHRWYEYTGQRTEEAAGWGWQRAHHPEDYPRVMQDWPRSIATGEPFNMESRIRGNDGAFRWFLVRAEPLRDARGAITRWYGTNTDIDDQKRTLQQTTRIAETLQAAFLPGQLPARPDLRFDALYLAAESEALIGGDWYDAFELPDGHIVVSIGDVIGHGVTAAVSAGRIRQDISAMAFDVADPGTILSKVNRMLQYQGDTVATALVAIIDPDLKSMRYASAGHPPPMLAASALAARSLPYGDLPLGVAAELDVQCHQVDLQRSAAILFYTDGVTEFKRNIESAEAQLLTALDGLVSDGAVSRPAAILQRAVMGDERPTDDAVLVLAQISPAPLRAIVDDEEVRKTWTFHSSDAYAAHSSRHELMRFVRRFLSAEDDLFRTELIIGELLANTVEHAPGLVEVEIDWSQPRPVVTMLDTGPGLTGFFPRLPDDHGTERGRGLFLVDTLAADVRVESTSANGTRMTVILPVTRDITA